jgi:hypothetical protein
MHGFLARHPGTLALGVLVAAWSASAGCSSGDQAAGTGASSSTSSAATTGSGGAGGSGGSGGSGGDTTTSSSTGEPSTWPACHTCLATKCSAQQKACGPECIAIQACLDAVCFNLSATGSPEEGQCQVHCQQLHGTGKATHLALVNCANSGSCQPPCAGYSYDYDQCIADADQGSCKTELAACNASQDCQIYRACAGTCTTLVSCLMCASGTGPAAGEKLYESYQQCLDTQCFAEGWLPTF